MKSRQALLIGARPQRASRIIDHMGRRGWRLLFADGFKSAKDILKETKVDLLMSQIVLADGTADQILSLVAGSSANAFFANSLADEAWWLHVLVDGKNHWWKPALLNPEEFSAFLDARLLTEEVHAMGAQVFA